MKPKELLNLLWENKSMFNVIGGPEMSTNYISSEKLKFYIQ